MPYHTSEDICKVLKDLSIPYTMYEHEPVFTVEEANKVEQNIPGAHIKNLFLRDKKKTGLWLVTCLHDVRVDLKAMKDVLGAKGNLSFCNADLLWEKLGVKPGSVTPLAAINDAEGEVKVILDERILQHDLVNPHPMQNDKTVGIASEDLVTFLENFGHKPEIMGIPSV